MRKILLAAAFQLSVLPALNAQQISGTVRDAQGHPVSDAMVSLLKARDSSLLKMELSGAGHFAFGYAVNDTLLVAIQYLGQRPFISSPFFYSGKALRLPEMTMTTDNTQLETVTVTGTKRLMEVKPDRTVIHVEGTIGSSGSNALELLSKSPGLMVDKDEHIQVQGKEGVKVYIDNKPTPVSGQDLGGYLKSIPSAQIEAIEIIYNPGSMYEAAGSAGIINIRLKRNKQIGFNGSINAGVNAGVNLQGDYGGTINFRNEKLNAYASYSGSYGRMTSDFELRRTVKDSLFSQRNRIAMDRNSHVFKAGLDYTPTAKSSIGFMVNGAVSTPELRNNSRTEISHKPSAQRDRVLLARNVSRQERANINSNLNYLYQDSAGRTFAVHADYGFYDNRQEQLQPNSFYDAAESQELYRRNYRISSPTRIDIYSLRADYQQTMWKGKLSAGVKTGFVETANIFDQYQQVGDRWDHDLDKSNFFRYREQVHAAYVNYIRELQSVTVQAGVRAEQTNVTGRLDRYRVRGGDYVAEASSFSTAYLDFFPSVSVTLAPKTESQVVLSYSRRIDRPVYQDLNPFEYRINEYTYHKGSTELRPQYSNTVSLSHSYKYKLNTTLSYSRVKDLFGQLVDTANGIRGYLVNANIASQDVASLNLSYPLQIRNYSLFTNVNTYYSSYRSDFGAGRRVDLDVWAVKVYAQNNYRFGKGWTAEVNGFYSSPSIWQGTMKSSHFWSVDAGLQKQVLKGEGTIKVSVSDVFKSQRWNGTSDFGGQHVYAAGSSDSRQLRIHFNYRFGNKGVKAARQFRSGVEDELNRTQSSGGLGH